MGARSVLSVFSLIAESLSASGIAAAVPEPDFAEFQVGQSVGVVSRDKDFGTTHGCGSSHVMVEASASEFRYFGVLPEFSGESGKKQEYCKPMAIYIQNVQKPDLLIQGDSRLWYSCNESKLGKLLFSVPDVLRTTLNADVETDGAAVLEDNKIIVRKPDGSLMFAHVVGEDVPALEIGSKVKDTSGLAMKLAARHFSLVDVDHDGTPDLVVFVNDGSYFYKGMAAFAGMEDGIKKIQGISFAPEKQMVRLCSHAATPGVGDMNGDTRRELLLGLNPGNVMVWKNDAALPAMVGGAYGVVEDFDGDGTPDMIMGGNACRVLFSALGIPVSAPCKGQETSPHCAP